MARRRRKPQGRKINPTLYVFCEGATEEAYINLLKTEYRLPSVVVHPKVKGIDISERFINRYKQEKSTHPKDRTFLFYDLDVTGTLAHLQKIKNSILLVSNPTVELWFLLHCKNANQELK